MAWVHVQDNPSGGVFTFTAGPVTSLSTGTFPSTNSLNNFVIVGVGGRITGTLTSSQITCTDNAAVPNTYSQVLYSPFYDGTYTRWCVLFIAKISSLPNSGNLNVTVSFPSTVDPAIAASEFSGGSITVETSNTNTATSTTPTPGSISTANSGDLIVSIVRTASTTLSGQSSFTNIALDQDAVNGFSIQLAYDIPGAVVSNFNQSWTTGSNPYEAGQAAIQASTVVSYSLTNPTLFGQSDAGYPGTLQYETSVSSTGLTAPQGSVVFTLISPSGVRTALPPVNVSSFQQAITVLPSSVVPASPPWQIFATYTGSGADAGGSAISATVPVYDAGVIPSVSLPSITGSGSALSVTVTVTGSFTGHQTLYLPLGGSFANGQNFPFTYVGQTSNIIVAVDNRLGQSGLNVGYSCYNALINDAPKVLGYFGTTIPTLNYSYFLITALNSLNNGSGGGYHLGCSDPIYYCDAAFQDWRLTQCIFLAEFSEFLMSQQNKGWNCAFSNGEALSRFIPEQMYPGILEGGAGVSFLTVDSWLNLSGTVTASGIATFSPDETQVTINFGGNSWTFYRPVVSPWNYTATGTTYWVATNGSDSNNGTSQSTPFATISHAASVAAAGDIVYVEAGSYIDNLNITTSGQSGKPIIISCAPGALGKVSITPSAAFYNANPDGSVILIGNNAQYIWINGLIIQGSIGQTYNPPPDHFSLDGITWTGGAGYGCRATNNVVYNNGHCGLKELNHGGTNILMEGNVIFSNGETGSNLDHGIYCPASNSTIDGNIIFNNAAWGMAIYINPVSTQIYKNICFNNGSGGISLSGTGGGIYNNTLAGSGTSIIYYSTSVNGVPCSNNTLKNNICENFNVDTQAGDATGNFDDYNDYIGGGTPSGSGVSSGTHEISVNPLFMNATTGDYRLQSNSPCKNVGTPISGVTTKTPNPNLGCFPDSL